MCRRADRPAASPLRPCPTVPSRSDTAGAGRPDRPKHRVRAGRMTPARRHCPQRSVPPPRLPVSLHLSIPSLDLPYLLQSLSRASLSLSLFVLFDTFCNHSSRARARVDDGRFLPSHGSALDTQGKRPRGVLVPGTPLTAMRAPRASAAEKTPRAGGSKMTPHQSPVRPPRVTQQRPRCTALEGTPRETQQGPSRPAGLGSTQTWYPGWLSNG